MKKKTFLTKDTLVLFLAIFAIGVIGYISLSLFFNHSESSSAELKKDFVNISHPSGIYKDSFFLTIDRSKLKLSHSIKYTTDGSRPNIYSKTYSNGITIDNSQIVNIIVLENKNEIVEDISLVYIIGEHTFPVVSLVTDPDNLWDKETGIYVSGKNSEKRKPLTYNFNKRGEDWRKPAKLSYFNEKGNKDLEMDVEIRISGGATRFHAQKSLRVCSKREFGNKNINYDFFDDPTNTEHKCVILRNSGNDWDRTMFRDILGQSLVYDSDVDTQMYKPAVVYLNGEYWGIHNIREFYDDNYINYSYGTVSEAVVIIEPDRKKHGYPVLRDGKKGDEKLYLEVIDNSHNYEYLKNNIDLENYIDYFLINVFVANTDWPENNIRVWKFKTDMYEHELFQPLDGKWRWLLFDLDTSFSLFNSSRYDRDTLDFATSEIVDGEKWPSQIIRTLLDNDDFRIMFINRYADLLNTNFSSENVLNTINYLEVLYEPEIPMHTEKWGGRKDKGNKPAFENIEVWKKNVEVLREFARLRPDYARMHVINKFGLSGTSKIYLKSSDKSAGQVKINTIDTKNNIKNEELIYFNDVPIEIEAVPNIGWKFVGWGNNNIEDKKKISLILSEDIVLEPEFKLTILGKLLQIL